MILIRKNCIFIKKINFRLVYGSEKVIQILYKFEQNLEKILSICLTTNEY